MGLSLLLHVRVPPHRAQDATSPPGSEASSSETPSFDPAGFRGVTRPAGAAPGARGVGALLTSRTEETHAFGPEEKEETHALGPEEKARLCFWFFSASWVPRTISSGPQRAGASVRADGNQTQPAPVAEAATITASARLWAERTRAGLADLLGHWRALSPRGHDQSGARYNAASTRQGRSRRERSRRLGILTTRLCPCPTLPRTPAGVLRALSPSLDHRPRVRAQRGHRTDSRLTAP